MKKQAVMMLSAALLVCACSDFSRYTTADADAPVKTRLRACMLSEANSRFQNGTLLTKTLSETADEISSVCLKKLALQSAGLDTEANSTAQTILNNLMNNSK